VPDDNERTEHPAFIRNLEAGEDLAGLKSVLFFLPTWQ